MPFKSKAQQRFMFSQHPEMAKRWAEHTPDIKSLPEKVDSDSNEKKSFVTAAELGRFTAFAEKRAALDPATANALGLGGAGALAGGISGMLGGYFNPGYEDRPDENGFLRRRQRNRLKEMFSKGLTGSALGAALGGQIGYAGTEMVRPFAAQQLRQDVENLRARGQELANGNSLQNLKEIARNNVNYLTAQVKQQGFENASRAQQHQLIAQHFKQDPKHLGNMIYDNPLASMANQATDYYRQKIAPYLK